MKAPLAHTLASGAVVAAIALPWLNPFAGGPSPNVLPWIASATGLVVLWLAGALRRDADAEGWARLAASGWLVAAVASAVIAGFQYFDLEDAFAPWMSVSPAGEAFANLRQRNQFASLTAIGLAATSWWLSRGLRLGPALAVAVLLGAMNAASASRTGALQLLALGLAAAWWGGPLRRPRILLHAAAIGAYVLGAWLLPLAQQAWTGLDPVTLASRLPGTEGCASRLVLWSNVLTLIWQKPLAGWGWGELDFAHFHHLYQGERFCDILDNAHNLPLHLAVELGLPVAVLVSALVLTALWRGRPWRETDPARQLAWCVLGVVFLHSMLEYPLWYGPFQVGALLSVWLLSLRRASPAAPGGPATRAPGPARAGVAALAATLLAYASWDYWRVSQVYRAQDDRAAAFRDDAMGHARQSLLFRAQARFAELTLAPLTPDNAQWTYDTAQAVVHYSPEPRVVEKLIESATMLERFDEAVLDLARYRAAFPADYERWRRAQKLPMLPP